MPEGMGCFYAFWNIYFKNGTPAFLPKKRYDEVIEENKENDTDLIVARKILNQINSQSFRILPIIS